ncbi:MAG: hypothetical protein ABI663_18700, partial [Chryseolinea sp.]
MKHLARILSLLILVSAGLFFASCGGGDPNPTSEEETQLNKFKGEWNMTGVSYDGVSKITDYVGIKVTFTGTFQAGGHYNYTSSLTGWPDVSAWKRDSEWKFKVVGTSITRLDDDPDVDIAYEFSNGGNT